jgi:hypothetical protein
MTIAILFQQSGYRTFTAFYTQHVQQHLRGEFPHLLSYTHFVELLSTVLVPPTARRCSQKLRAGVCPIAFSCSWELSQWSGRFV